MENWNGGNKMAVEQIGEAKNVSALLMLVFLTVPKGARKEQEERWKRLMCIGISGPTFFFLFSLGVGGVVVFANKKWSMRQ